MTPAEQLKWKNKLRLWRVLHPNSRPYDECLVCHYNNSTSTSCSGVEKLKLFQNILTGKIFESLEEEYKTWDCVEFIRKP